MNNLKFDWNDITIVPATLSDIRSRQEINILNNNKLPLFVSPMDTVVDLKNYKYFLEKGYEVCVPRGEDMLNHRDVDKFFVSLSITEFEELLNNETEPPQKVLVDVANGHMKALWDLSKAYKERYPNKELMIGNIANPKTFLRYAEIGVDWVRTGIGGGSACTTSANTSVHYPMGSLIEECAKYKIEYPNTKIVADGGFRNFSDIIKALAVGADAVMLGSILNKALESCTPKFKLLNDEFYEEINDKRAKELFDNGEEIYSYFRGMSTKEVQKKWGKEKLTTSEGITKYNKVEYTLGGWTENFKDYLKSAMSYCGKRDIQDFIGKAEYVHMTQNAFNRYNK